MAYMIQKLAKAHYLCINIECDNKVLTELETGFRFNDAVLRHLTVVKDPRRDDAFGHDEGGRPRGIAARAAPPQEARPDQSAGADGEDRRACGAQVHAGRLAGDRRQPEARIGDRPGRQRRARSASRSAAAPSAPITESLLAAELGTDHVFAGFLGAQRNGRGIVFHIQSIEFEIERSSHAPAPR